MPEVFEDTPAELNVFDDCNSAGTWLDRVSPEIAFLNPEMVSPSFAQKIKVHRETRPGFRLIALQSSSEATSSFQADMAFDDVPSLLEFQKKFVRVLPLPVKIKVLVIDDEPEIPAMIKDFLENRSQPVFEIEVAENGKLGLEKISMNKPDVLVMDVKMPEMDGRELYRRIRGKQIDVPVIVFFDPISGTEIKEIRKYGRPAVVDKSSRHASLPELTALILKMAYFG